MTLNKDIQYLSAGIPELENYLLSKELYYPLGVNLPQLTLGGILLALARAGEKGSRHESQIERIHAKWRVAWEAKVERESRARCKLWKIYLAEYRDDPRAGAHLYAQNVRYRTMMSLMGILNHESDPFLRGIFVQGRFIWEEECAPNFPRDRFWYLFGSIKE